MSWNDRYLAHDTPWDLGQPSTLVQALVREVLPPGARLLVPGCGLGHDVVALALAGYEVIGLDLAPAAIDRARALHGETPGVTWRVGDLLAPSSLLDGTLDGVIEHTCYCALAPDGPGSAPLDAYADAVHRLLRAGGALIGAFLAFDDGGQGPPWGTSTDRLQARFGDRFTVERLAAWPPFGPRGVPQLAAIFRKPSR